MQRTITKKNKITFSSGNFLIILYQLFKFEAPVIVFEISSFLGPNLKRAIKKNAITFLNYHQVIYALS